MVCRASRGNRDSRNRLPVSVGPITGWWSGRCASSSSVPVELGRLPICPVCRFRPEVANGGHPGLGGPAAARTRRASSQSCSHLRDERLDRLEPLLAARRATKRTGVLVVEVAVEVEEVGLEQRGVGLARRTSAGVRATWRAGGPPVGHARTSRRRCRRPAAGSRPDGDVGRREAERRGPARRRATTPRTSSGRPSMRGGGVDVALGERAADGGGRHGSSTSAAARRRGRAGDT